MLNKSMQVSVSLSLFLVSCLGGGGQCIVTPTSPRAPEGERKTEGAELPRLSPFSATQPSPADLAALLRGHRPQPNRDQTVNPHWGRDGCLHCHETVDQKLKKIEPAAINALCWRCHDGTHARREVHPVDRSVTNPQTAVPANWPLPGGTLSCITCHDVMSAGHAQVRPAFNSGFLREFRGGSAAQFCARCHRPPEGQDRYSPHVMLDQNHHIIAQACAFCHGSHAHPMVGQTPEAEIPRDCSFCHRVPYAKQDIPVRSGRPKLRVEEPFLCLSCHPSHIDYFEPGHIGAQVPARIKAYMVAAEKVNYQWPVPPELIEEALKSGGQPARLHLLDGNTVVCSTCHNPHADGLFPADSILAAGAMQPTRSASKTRLRDLGVLACRGCHEK